MTIENVNSSSSYTNWIGFNETTFGAIALVTLVGYVYLKNRNPAPAVDENQTQTPVQPPLGMKAPENDLTQKTTRPRLVLNFGHDEGDSSQKKVEKFNPNGSSGSTKTLSLTSDNGGSSSSKRAIPKPGFVSHEDISSVGGLDSTIRKTSPKSSKKKTDSAYTTPIRRKVEFVDLKTPLTKMRGEINDCFSEKKTRSTERGTFREKLADSLKDDKQKALLQRLLANHLISLGLYTAAKEEITIGIGIESDIKGELQELLIQCKFLIAASQKNCLDSSKVGDLISEIGIASKKDLDHFKIKSIQGYPEFRKGMKKSEDMSMLCYILCINLIDAGLYKEALEINREGNRWLGQVSEEHRDKGFVGSLNAQKSACTKFVEMEKLTKKYEKQLEEQRQIAESERREEFQGFNNALSKIFEKLSTLEQQRSLIEQANIRLEGQLAMLKVGTDESKAISKRIETNNNAIEAIGEEIKQNAPTAPPPPPPESQQTVLEALENVAEVNLSIGTLGEQLKSLKKKDERKHPNTPKKKEPTEKKVTLKKPVKPSVVDAMNTDSKKALEIAEDEVKKYSLNPKEEKKPEEKSNTNAPKDEKKV